MYVDFAGGELKVGDYVVFYTKKRGMHVGIIDKLHKDNSATIQFFYDENGCEIIKSVPTQNIYGMRRNYTNLGGLYLEESRQLRWKKEYDRKNNNI